MLSCSLVFIGVYWCSLDFNHYFGVFQTFWTYQKGIPGNHRRFHLEIPRWKKQKRSMDIHTGPPPRRWRLSISLRFAITLGRLRVMYLGSCWKTPWGLEVEFQPPLLECLETWPTTIVNHSWFLDLCYPQKKMGESHPAGWPHEHSGIRHCYNWCSSFVRNARRIPFEQPTVPTRKP